jgi:hypothetical protein
MSQAATDVNRPNFLPLSYLSDTCLSSIKMFHLLPKKMFVFNTTFNLFGAEIGVAKIRQPSKIWPNFSSVEKINYTLV